VNFCTGRGGFQRVIEDFRERGSAHEGHAPCRARLLRSIEEDVRITMKARQVPLIFRFIYFLFVGLWLGLICAKIGWLLCVTVVGLPFGIWVLHRLPLVTTLTMPDEEYNPISHARDFQHATTEEPFPFVVRAAWFVLVGWWLSAAWIAASFALAATFVLSPFGFWMINRVPAVLTLEGV
jgi:uncharacterized membrane protein YccF (DUF307 family)